MKFSKKVSSLAVVTAIVISANANADKPPVEEYEGICDDISFDTFKDAAVAAAAATNGFGFSLPMWATLMDITGKVCHVVAVSSLDEIGGVDVGNSAWLGSRVISAQKANTANSFSINGLSIPTGAVSAAVYPGGSLYGLQHSNPVDTESAYEGNATLFGTEQDPLEGERVGGVNVFGGGIALYDVGNVKVGAVGVSGDTSCRDASMAYVLRRNLGLDDAPNPDILYLTPTAPDTLFEQPLCGYNDPEAADNVGAQVGESPFPPSL